MEKTLDEQQPVEQAGFRRKYSTLDHIQTLTLLIQKCKEYNLPLYLGFVDFEKAFDSVHIHSIVQALKKIGIDKTYIDILINIYNSATASVSLYEKTKPFSVLKGVRQGDIISPKLFTTVLDYAMKSLNWNRKGININGKYLNHLRFADDIVIITQDKNELQDMLRELEMAVKPVGLKINAQKTKYMKYDRSGSGQN